MVDLRVSLRTVSMSAALEIEVVALYKGIIRP